MPSRPETLQTAEQLSQEFGNRFLLLSQSWTQPYVEAFRRATPADEATLLPFWQATEKLGRLAMQKATGVMLPQLNQNNHHTPALAIAIPRGAYPFLYGIRQYSPHIPFIITNDGGNKNPIKPLIPEAVQPTSVGRLLLIDPVIDTGETLRRTIGGLNQRGVVADHVIALGVIAHSPTVRSLLEQYPALHIVTADIEDSWIPAPDGNGRWLAGFGDIGANVQAAIIRHPALGKHMKEPGLYTAQ